jgi:hypothetical protein
MANSDWFSGGQCSCTAKILDARRGSEGWVIAQPKFGTNNRHYSPVANHWRKEGVMMLGWKRNDGWKKNLFGLVMLVLSACFLFGVMEAQQGGRIERERVGQKEGRGRFPELMGRFGQRFPSDLSFFPPNSRQRLSGLGFRSRQQSQNVELVGFTGGAIHDVFVKNNYAYCASVSGLLIFNVSNPSNPQLVGKLLLPGANGVYVSGSMFEKSSFMRGKKRSISPLPRPNT